jgi:hypothetical protein
VPARLAEGGIRGLQGMAGRWEGARFVPRFPFVAGEAYAVVGVGGEVLGCIARPAVSGEASTVVSAVYPSGDTVPLNLLRIYVHFSAAMSEGFAARGIRMLDAATGAEIPGVFLHMEPELWDPGHRRLTLFLDPARIKRGLVPHEEMGYPLREGSQVILSVGTEMQDAKGRPLREAASKTWGVVDALRSRIDPSQWRMRTSDAGALIEFFRNLDHALLQRCIHADGEISVNPGERSVRITPAPKTLRVDATLEDVCGNAVTHVFDRDLDDPTHDPVDVRSLTVEVPA